MNNKNAVAGRVAQEDINEFNKLLSGVALGSAATGFTIIPATTFLTYKAPIRLGGGSKLLGGLFAGVLIASITQDLLYSKRLERAKEIMRKYPELLD